MTENHPIPEIAPTNLLLKALYAALVSVIFLATIFLVILLVDSGLANFQSQQATKGKLIGTGYVVIALLFLVGSSMLLFSALAQLMQAVRLENRGEIVDAIVLEKRLEKDQKGNRFCFVILGFNADFHIKQSISQENYLRLKVGDKVKMRYLPSNPAIARIENLS